MHNVFISYYHHDDQKYKDGLVTWAKNNNVFIDGSVDTGDIDDTEMTDEQIRTLIRDEYLRDTSVTIVLVGPNTKHRKHVDWEIYSSMHDSKLNKKSGIIVILLPEVQGNYYTAAHPEEKSVVYPYETNWTTIKSREECKQIYPYLSERLVDNVFNEKARISVINWKDLTSDNLRFMIECAYKDRENCVYDFSTPMRRRNG